MLHNPAKLAWILEPLKNLLYGLPGLQGAIFDEIEKILAMDMSYKNGRPKTSVIKAKIKVFEALIEQRAISSGYKGGV